ncbi:DUF7119 family protein [Haloferax larsenii]|uniref:DUF7119 domain-containing protein n=1 Tax=Haloferax larsenii TaxID=302484 RepID=A0A1H7NE80_HALLR|nr:hypothetical protein [Haloferax larsenii]ELZ79774.1 hypothetical protein C455_07370 [Haloferax larsenii JCM 13917]UVE50954.1 hypothetical protein KU306_03435 [Haloferax larsenii]SEL21886.1 hypothetical protein SAMN04488691_103287 [Haloferax larsenii]
MTNDERPGTHRVRADRAEPVGAPVVRGDPAVTGERASEAVGFDPDDPESVAEAARTVRSFAESSAGDDHVLMLRGAAACAALVRGVGSYKRAAERAGGDVSVSFIRKWARVHDLPQSVRRHVARGRIAPTAAKHIARVSGDARLHLAWATLDAGLTVREVRRLASEINNGQSATEVLEAHGVDLGTLDVSLPPAVYLELRRRASLDDVDPGTVVADALDDYFD